MIWPFLCLHKVISTILRRQLCTQHRLETRWLTFYKTTSSYTFFERKLLYFVSNINEALFLTDNKSVLFRVLVSCGRGIKLLPEPPMTYLTDAYIHVYIYTHLALLQLHLDSQLNTWLQWIGQRRLQDKMEKRLRFGFGVAYNRSLTGYAFMDLLMSFKMAGEDSMNSQSTLKLNPINSWKYIGVYSSLWLQMPCCWSPRPSISTVITIFIVFDQFHAKMIHLGNSIRKQIYFSQN